MEKPTNSRIATREMIFKLIFETCFHEPQDSVMYEEFLQNNECNEEDLEFLKTIYVGVLERKKELDSLIESKLKKYTLSRLMKVDYSILLMSIYELKFYQKTSAKVVINEAVKLAKKYSDEKSYAFINGVLREIVKE